MAKGYAKERDEIKRKIARMMAKYGPPALVSVLKALSEECRFISHYVMEKRQDLPEAKAWKKMADRLDKLHRQVEIEL